MTLAINPTNMLTTLIVYGSDSTFTTNDRPT
jgi:hypothetical protein